MPYASVIDWYGPFATIAALKDKATAWGLVESLYVAIGSRPRQRGVDIQYVGITTDLTLRFDGKHPIQTVLRRENLRLYIGLVSSQQVAGRKATHHARNWSALLYLAESALAFLMELPLNKAKRCTPPGDSVVVINRWYSPDEVRRRRRPHPSWPDLVEYDIDENIGDLAWHGRRRKHLNSEAIIEIGRRARQQRRDQKDKALKEALALLDVAT